MPLSTNKFGPIDVHMSDRLWSGMMSLLSGVNICPSFDQKFGELRWKWADQVSMTYPGGCHYDFSRVASDLDSITTFLELLESAKAFVLSKSGEELKDILNAAPKEEGIVYSDRSRVSILEGLDVLLPSMRDLRRQIGG
jgi:hypothetical protein